MRALDFEIFLNVQQVVSQLVYVQFVVIII